MAERYSLTLARDSVAAGDDADAPHFDTLDVAADARAVDICLAIKWKRYLARIAGGHATWVVLIDGVAIGIIGQSDHPKTLVEHVTLRPDSKIFCQYCAQDSADAIYAQYVKATAERAHDGGVVPCDTFAPQRSFR